VGTVYATIADRDLYGVAAVSFGVGVTTAQKNAALASASAVIDSYFRGRYALPLFAWGVEVVRCCVFLADYELLASRGFNPAAGADANVLDRYREMIGEPGREGWLQRVQRRAAHPDVTETTQDAKHQRPRVFSSSVVDCSTGATAPNRGW
jgi:phage gp36-like protein